MAVELEQLSDAELDRLVAEKQAIQGQAAPQAQDELDNLSDQELDALVFEKMQAIDQAQPEDGPSTLEQIGTAGRSVLSGFTGGLSEPVISAVQAPILTGGNAFLESRDAGEDFLTAIQKGLQAATDPEELQQAIEFDIETRKQLQEESPGLDIGGQIVGSLSPASVPAKVFGAGVKAAGALPAIGKATGLIGKVGRGAIGAGIGGAASGGISETAEQAQQAAAGQDFDVGEIAGATIEGGKGAAAVGAAIPAIGATARAIKKIPSKLLTSFGGVPESTIKKYVANAERINKTPDKHIIIEEIEGVAQNLERDFNKAKITKEQAKEALKVLETQIKDSLQGKKLDLSDKLKEVNLRVSNALEGKKAVIQKVANVEGRSQELMDDVGKLKDKLIGGSGRSREALDQSSEVIFKDMILGSIDQQIKKLKIKGIAIGETRKAAIGKLEVIRKDVTEFTDMIKLNDAKSILQALDDDISFAISNNQFSKAFDGAAAKVRGALNKEIRKKVPEFATIMDEVADDARLLADLNKKTKTLSNAGNLLKNAVKRDEDKQLLSALGKKVGVDYDKIIKDATKAQKQIGTSTGLQRLKASLPESAEQRLIEGELALAKRASVKRNIIKKSTAAKSRALKDAEKDLQRISDEFLPLKGIARTGAASQVKSFLSSQGTKNRKLVDKISKLTDKDLTQMLDDIAVSEQFTKDATRGSKNVNLWAFIGTGIGLGGFTAGPAGIAAGAIVGAMADRFAPKLTRSILNQVVKINGIPTVQKINKLELPPKAKKYLIDQLQVQLSEKKKRARGTE